MFGNDTLPETNIAPKMYGWKMKFLFEMVPFHGTFVNFREGNMFKGSHSSNVEGGKRHIDMVMHPAFHHPNGTVDISEFRRFLRALVDILYRNFPIPLDLVLFGDFVRDSTMGLITMKNQRICFATFFQASNKPI